MNSGSAMKTENGSNLIPKYGSISATEFLDQIASPLITSQELAILLRKDDSTIRRRCDNEEFEGAFKDGKGWLIPKKTVLEMLTKAVINREMAYK